MSSQTWVAFCIRIEQVIQITVFLTLATSNNELICYLGAFCYLHSFLVAVFMLLPVPNQMQDSWILTVRTEGATYISNPLEATFTANGSKLAVDILHKSYLFLAIGGFIWPIKERKYTNKILSGSGENLECNSIFLTSCMPSIHLFLCAFPTTSYSSVCPTESSSCSERCSHELDLWCHRLVGMKDDEKLQQGDIL